MKTNVNFDMFVQSFINHNRFDQFGKAALMELFGHIEAFEVDTGEEFTLDVVGLCCDWSVMSRQEILEQHDMAMLDREDYLEYLELDDVDFADEVRGELDAYCYDIGGDKYLICDAMI